MNQDLNHPPENSNPWVGRLKEYLEEEEAIQAIFLNPDSRQVKVATLEGARVDLLKAGLYAVLRELEAHLHQDPASETSSAFEGSSNQHPAQSFLVQKPHSPNEERRWRWREFSWPEPEQKKERYQEDWRPLAIQAALCGAALGAALVCERSSGPLWLTRACFVMSLIAGGWDAARETSTKLRRWEVDIHFLMLCVALGAMAIGAWTEAALLLFLFSTSGALEHYALHRTHREIDALTKSAPKTARIILPDGHTEERPVDVVKVGDKLSLRPDELFPVDGTVLSGDSAADESSLTGESVPVGKSKGAKVSSGTLNLWGPLTVLVDRVASQSSLQRIISLIQHAQHLRAPSERFTDRFGTRYTWLVLSLTTGMFFIWWLVFHLSPFISTPGQASAFYRSMTLLVVMSPCALALSIPSAILAAIAWGARHGILFRGGAAIEKLAEVDVVCMDKTGTLTEGLLRVMQVESFPPGQEASVARIAFSLDSQSNHPVSRAISQYGIAQGITAATVAGFQRISGAGLRGEVDGELCYVGRRELVQQGNFARWMETLPDTPLGYSEVWVLSPNLLGRILLLDTIRKDTGTVLSSLQREGLQTVMLTGDRRAAAEEIARGLGLTEVRAGLKPEDKVSAIVAFTRQGHKVAMVGDGVNDAPSLAAAYVSIAMGARGSDAALEQSDVVLMKDDIGRLVTALSLSHRARAVIHQNLAISLGAITLATVASLTGWLHLTAGVVVHEGSTLLVCLNSLRLLVQRDHRK